MQGMVMFNITVEPLKIEHVGYIAEDAGEDIILQEIIRLTYPHPDQPDIATVTNLEIRVVARMSRKAIDAGPAIVIEAANKTAKAQIR